MTSDCALIPGGVLAVSAAMILSHCWFRSVSLGLLTCCANYMSCTYERRVYEGMSGRWLLVKVDIRFFSVIA